MELSKEQIEVFRKQIIQQIENNFSEDRKDPAIEKIKSMNNEEFIEFLKKNKLLTDEQDKENYDASSKQGKQGNPFRMIINGEIPYYLVEENKQALAVLEIRPISKAHIIIIPKKPISKSEKIPKTILALAEKISKKIKSKFKPKEVLISSSYVFEEIIINVLPVYSSENLESNRKEATQEELEELKKEFVKKELIKKEKIPKLKTIEESKIWLPRRIP